jgi:hypothetical protein
MISYKTIACRGFVLCVGSALPEDVLVQPNTGAGVAMQYAYVYRGHAAITNGRTTEALPGRQLLNLTKYMGTEVTFTMLGDPTMWIAINPASEGTRFTAEFVGGGETITVSGGDQRKTILCLEGEVLCNEISVAALKYAPVRNDSTVTLDVPEGSAAVVLTTI